MESPASPPPPLFQTLRYEPLGKIIRLQMNRPERQNAINTQLVSELHMALDHAEASPEARLLVLSGSKDYFCTGIDFQEAVKTREANPKEIANQVRSFYQLLRRLTCSPLFIAAEIEGRVNAGGVGLVCAADYAVASASATFNLSEVLFGLMPATVIPFLIRRTGFQPAYLLTLTAQKMEASEAQKIRLIDEVPVDLEDAMRRLLIRVGRVEPSTLGTVKNYFNHMWLINDETEEQAVSQISQLMKDPRTQSHIRAFVHKQTFP